MLKKNLLLTLIALLGAVFVYSPSCLAGSDSYVLLSVLVLAGASILAYFCATIMVMFGLSYATAFLAAFGILLVSFFVGDYFSRNIMDKLPRPAEREVPADSTDNSVREIKLS
jgi:hypothetical protein